MSSENRWRRQTSSRGTGVGLAVGTGVAVATAVGLSVAAGLGVDVARSDVGVGETVVTIASTRLGVGDTASGGDVGDPAEHSVSANRPPGMRVEAAIPERVISPSTTGLSFLISICQSF
jgi:hypothetical protein